MSLSIHIVDVARGVPAAQVPVVLYRIESEQYVEVARDHTDGDGRVTAPFGGELVHGVYELCFDVGTYHARTATASFYNEIPVRFTIDAPKEHYHIPLLLSPWGYSTYRGS